VLLLLLREVLPLLEEPLPPGQPLLEPVLLLVLPGPLEQAQQERRALPELLPELLEPPEPVLPEQVQEPLARLLPLQQQESHLEPLGAVGVLLLQPQLPVVVL